MAQKTKRIAAKVTEQEFEALYRFAKRDGRTATEVLREFIRSLPTYKPIADIDEEEESIADMK